MESTTVNLPSLADRVERLERQNRLWKRAALTLLLLPATLFVMGQASSNRTLTAQKLVITDASGKPRATLAPDGDGATLSLTGADGKLSVLLGSDTAGGALALTDANGRLRVILSGGADAHLDILDAEGYQATIGSTDLVTPATGETQKTSAAAVTLFDKKNHVIWKAP